MKCSSSTALPREATRSRGAGLRRPTGRFASRGGAGSQPCGQADRPTRHHAPSTASAVRARPTPVSRARLRRLPVAWPGRRLQVWHRRLAAAGRAWTGFELRASRGRLDAARAWSGRHKTQAPCPFLAHDDTPVPHSVSAGTAQLAGAIGPLACLLRFANWSLSVIIRVACPCQ